MDTVGKRLAYVMEIRGLSQSDLARQVGVRQQTIYKLCVGLTHSTRCMRKLATALRVSEEWLATGHGNKNLIFGQLANPEESELIIPILKPKDIGSYFCKIKDEDIVIFDDTQPLLKVVCGGSPHSYALKMEGDSMNNPSGAPSLLESALVIVDPHKSIKPFDIIVGQVEVGAPVIRQYVKEFNQVFFKPLNPRYPMSEIDEKKLITYGVVIKAVSLL